MRTQIYINLSCSQQEDTLDTHSIKFCQGLWFIISTMVSKLYLALFSLQWVAKTTAAPIVDILDSQGNALENRQNIPFLYHCEQGCSTCNGGVRANGMACVISNNRLIVLTWCEIGWSADNSECTSFNSRDTFPASYQTEAGGWNVFFDTRQVSRHRY